MEGWQPRKGMKIMVKDVLYVVSKMNIWYIHRNETPVSEFFEYRNKENGKKYISTVSKFDEGVVNGLIQLV